MKGLKRIFDFYLDASVHVALAIYSLLQVTSLLLNISPNNHLSFFLFFGSISCYNFIKYGVEAEKYILVIRSYHKWIQIFSLISLGLACYHVYFLGIKVWTGIIILVLLTGLYALPVLPKAKNLRSLGGLKIFVVALVWAGATVVLPILSQNYALTFDHKIAVFQRFVLVLVLLVPFEVRDLNFDKPELRTLPQRYGVKTFKLWGGFVIILFFFSTFLKDEFLIQDLFLRGILTFVLGYVLFITERKQSKYFSSFWVESIPIFWYVVALFTEDFFTAYREVALSF